MAAEQSPQDRARALSREMTKRASSINAIRNEHGMKVSQHVSLMSRARKIMEVLGDSDRRGQLTGNQAKQLEAELVKSYEGIYELAKWEELAEGQITELQQELSGIHKDAREIAPDLIPRSLPAHHMTKLTALFRDSYQKLDEETDRRLGVGRAPLRVQSMG